MNLGHSHLILNHIPIVGIPVSLVFLARGLWGAKSVDREVLVDCAFRFVSNGG